MRVLIGLLPLLPAFSAIAQSAGYSIRGKVIDAENKRPVEKATIQLEQTPHSVLTDSTGYFELPGLKPGSYVLIVSHVGYQSYKKTIRVKDTAEYVEAALLRTPATGSRQQCKRINGK